MNSVISAVLTPTELKHLAEVREVCVTTASPGWLLIMSEIEKFVEEAKEAMVGNVSSDPMSYMRFQLRWQQREAMLRGINDYVRSCQDERDVLLKETSKTYAEQDRDERWEDARGTGNGGSV